MVQESVLFANGYQRYIYCEGFDPPRPDENNICNSEFYAQLLNISARGPEQIVAAGSVDALRVGVAAAATSVSAPLCLASIVDSDGKRYTDHASTWCDIVFPLYSLKIGVAGTSCDRSDTRTLRSLGG